MVAAGSLLYVQQSSRLAECSSTAVLHEDTYWWWLDFWCHSRMLRTRQVNLGPRKRVINRPTTARRRGIWLHETERAAMRAYALRVARTFDEKAVKRSIRSEPCRKRLTCQQHLLAKTTQSSMLSFALFCSPLWRQLTRESESSGRTAHTTPLDLDSTTFADHFSRATTEHKNPESRIQNL